MFSRLLSLATLCVVAVILAGAACGPKKSLGPPYVVPGHEEPDTNSFERDDE